MSRLPKFQIMNMRRCRLLSCYTAMGRWITITVLGGNYGNQFATKGWKVLDSVASVKQSEQ